MPFVISSQTTFQILSWSVSPHTDYTYLDFRDYLVQTVGASPFPFLFQTLTHTLQDKSQLIMGLFQTSMP